VDFSLRESRRNIIEPLVVVFHQTYLVGHIFLTVPSSRVSLKVKSNGSLHSRDDTYIGWGTSIGAWAVKKGEKMSGILSDMSDERRPMKHHHIVFIPFPFDTPIVKSTGSLCIHHDGGTYIHRPVWAVEGGKQSFGVFCRTCPTKHPMKHHHIVVIPSSPYPQ